jgi:dCTP deaminase
MGVLNRDQIINRINPEGADKENYAQRLIITPLLDDRQIGPGSVDIRLGASIIVPKRTYVESQDVTNPMDSAQIEARRYTRIRLRYHSPFILHPNELILAATFEYLSLPYDLTCSIASRSSWGRLGLVVATAAVVQPGYKGCLTLELVNVSASPIVLYPGLPVGQLIFYEVIHPTYGPGTPQYDNKEFGKYAGRYRCSTEAEYPLFHAEGSSDQDMSWWGKKKDQ